MAIKIRTKKQKNGVVSIFLDIHHKGVRWSVFPGLRCKEKPSTEFERRERKEKMAVAEELAMTYSLQLVRDEFCLGEKFDTGRDFVNYMEQWIAEHSALLDIRMYRSALAKLKEFAGKGKIPCFELNESYWKRFSSYLKQGLNGATPNNYLKKLKRVVRAATDEKLFREDPIKDIVIPTKPFHEKAALTFDEMRKMWHANCGNNDVKRAFLFSCLTGLRFCDVEQMRWKNIGDRHVTLVQKKTKIPVSISLTDDALILLGEAKTKEYLVFNLPSHTGCLKHLRSWAADAGIEKKVTWHVGRHSFATNLIESSANIAVVSKLLGHTSLTHTQRYLKISEKSKDEAIKKLPKIS